MTKECALRAADGTLVRPNAEAAAANPAVYPAAAASNELTFTFNASPTDTHWSSGELESVQAWLNACYPIAKTVYGVPAFANQINVRKDITISPSGEFFSGTEEIVLKVIDGGVVCHEMLHAFRDDFILGIPYWEEGMTRAAEIEVTKRAGITDSETNANGDAVHYQELNTPVVGVKGGSPQLDGWSQGLLRYRLAGYAWSKGVLEDQTFLANFNASLYAKAAVDRSIQSTETALIALASQIKPAIEDQTFTTWYAVTSFTSTSSPYRRHPRHSAPYPAMLP